MSDLAWLDQGGALSVEYKNYAARNYRRTGFADFVLDLSELLRSGRISEDQFKILLNEVLQKVIAEEVSKRVYSSLSDGLKKGLALEL